MKIPQCTFCFLSSRWRPWAVVAVVFAMAAAWLWPVGWVDDDRAYAHMILPTDRWSYYTECHGPRLTSVAEALTSAVSHWQYTNGRLSDKLLMVLQLPPLGAEGANMFCALTITAMMWLTCAAAGLRRSAGALLLCALLCWWCLPWGALFAQRAYILNYCLPSVMMMGLIWLLEASRRWTGLRIAGAMLLSLCTAWTHEIFGGTVLCYLTVATLMPLLLKPIRPATAPRRVLLLCLGAAAVGQIVNISSPGNALRLLETRAEFGWLILFRHLTRLGVAMLPVAAACGTTAVAMLKRRRLAGSWLGSAEMWASVTAMLVTSAIAIPMIAADRYVWGAIVLAVYIILRTSAALWPRVYAVLSSRWVLVPCLALYVCWGLQVARAQAWRSRIEAEMFNRLASGGSHIVEYDVPDQQQWPWYVAALVKIPQGVSDSFARFDGFAYGYGRHAVYAPPGCAHKPLSEWPKLPGNNEIHGANGIYYVPAKYARSLYIVTFGEAQPCESPLEKLYNGMRGVRPMPPHLVTPERPAIPKTYADFTMNYSVPVGDINGEPAHMFFLGEMRRGLLSRKILRVDSIPPQPE